MEKKVSNFTVEGARIFNRNFQGIETEYNDAGNRNFCLMLDPELAENLVAYGWNVKFMPPREDDPDQIPQAYMKVKVKFGQYPPIVNLINSRGKLRLTEETIDQLDYCMIDNIDVVIRPYQYPPSRMCPEGGISAYLKAIYVTIREDNLELKYADIPDLN